jgi:hypothetical protein
MHIKARRKSGKLALYVEVRDVDERKRTHVLNSIIVLIVKVCVSRLGGEGGIKKC